MQYLFSNRSMGGISVFLFCFSFFAYSQINSNHQPGEMIVWLKKEASVERLTADYRSFKNASINLSPKKMLSSRLNIWLVSYNPAFIHEDELLSSLQNRQDIQVVQFNHTVSLRSTSPNDSLFNEQWDLLNTGQGGGIPDADIDVEEAWDSTTGGVTVAGDSIVVAIIDEGFDDNHSDWGNNLWFNYKEIPNNNIDDDNNGYIDDYRGWNTYNNNDDVNGGGGWHGTSVAGIVGAKGNNGRGVTGINWNVKLMLIAGSSTDEATVVASYSYALEMRARYNASNGTEGAFVVATNSSFGLDFGKPADAPLWCAMYDSMGAYGIVSAAATANADVNVDVMGDLPTACSSPYMISVTNTTRYDTKESQAGYGIKTIDLGAPGTDAYTLDAGNGYGPFGGTSGATPHVAGTVALLYATACQKTMQYCKSFPDSCALLIRNAILEGVDSAGALAGITATGGRLNVFNSLQLLRLCGDGLFIKDKWSDTTDTTGIFSAPAGPSSLQIVSVSPNPAQQITTLRFNATAGSSSVYIKITDLLGREVFFEKEPASGNRLHTKTIDLSGQQPGVYLLSLESGRERSGVVKIVVLK